MPKYNVECYMCQTQIEEVEAASPEDAEKIVKDTLYEQLRMINNPPDFTYGVVDVRELESEKEDEGGGE